MQLKIAIISFPFLLEVCEAKDLGVVGTVFEISEKSLLKVIEDRLQKTQESGKLEGFQRELQRRILHSIERPQAIIGLEKATSYQVSDYDPSFVLDKDIKDHKGSLIAKEGTTHNPLDYYSFGVPLLLIDGDDISQVSWALLQQGKIVLIQGAPILLAKIHGRRFFFDQGGVLVKKFKISKIPARVSQRNKILMIEEINPTEIIG